jgi:hypothetical protein
MRPEMAALFFISLLTWANALDQRQLCLALSSHRGDQGFKSGQLHQGLVSPPGKGEMGRKGCPLTPVAAWSAPLPGARLRMPGDCSGSRGSATGGQRLTHRLAGRLTATGRPAAVTRKRGTSNPPLR